MASWGGKIVWIFVGALNGLIRFMNRTIFGGIFQETWFQQIIYSIFYSSVFNLQVSVTEINVSTGQSHEFRWRMLTVVTKTMTSPREPNVIWNWLKLRHWITGLMFWLGFVVGCECFSFTCAFGMFKTLKNFNGFLSAHFTATGMKGPREPTKAKHNWKR